MLNGFHSQERALVMSYSGYPDYLMPQLEKCLQHQPDLPVFLLHDGQRAPAMMAESVRRLVADRQVVDMGLSLNAPAEIKRLKKVRMPRRVAVPLDFLPYLMLTNGIAAAMLHQMTLSELVGQSAAMPDTGSPDVLASFG